jgi:hypothetical protein
MAVKLYSELRDFSLGINQKDDPTLIADQELIDAENVIFGKGFAQKRSGYEQYSEQFTGAVNRLYEFKKSNGTKEFLAVSSQILFKVNDDFSYIATGFGLTTSNAKMVTYKNRSIQDRVLLADGGKLKTYDGTSVSEVTPHVPITNEPTNPGLNDINNLTNFRTLAMKKDRLFAVAHPTVKNRVNFCYHDPYLGYAVYDYFPATYFFDIAPEDNDEIVEIKVFRDLLIILMKKSVWALRGDGVTLNDNELFKINVPNGCIAPNSVQEVGNNLFYLGDDHVYSIFATDQDYTSAQIVSGKIAPILNGIGATDKALATSVFFDNKYWLSFPNGITLVYDVILECWTKFTNIQANSFLVRDGVLYFSSNDGYIYRFNENRFNDNGQPINYYLQTKILNFGMPINKKKFRRIWFITKEYDGYESSFIPSLTIDQTLLIDLNQVNGGIKTDSSGIWDSSNWNQAVWDSKETIKTEYKVRQKGNDVQIKITNNQMDQPVSLYGIYFEYEDKGIK